MNGASNDDNFESSADDETDLDQNYYTPCSGLVGLQNIANTCYMNAALQALSNTPPLTGYFLECGNIIETNYEMAAPTSSQRKTGLAKNYYRLVKDMWLGQKQKNGFASNASKFGRFSIEFRIQYSECFTHIVKRFDCSIFRLRGTEWHFVRNS